MILIAGGTGTLGTQVVRLLTARGLEVRILTRDPARAAHLRGNLLEIMSGDVRDARAIERAVERLGNSNLIEAAKAGAAEHFILVSIQGAAPDHPIEVHRMKYLAEQELKASGLAWTIIRPTAYIETWAALLGEPLLKSAKTRIFGRGYDPINFVSAYDVARFVELPSSIPPCAVRRLRSVGLRTSA